MAATTSLLGQTRGLPIVSAKESRDPFRLPSTA